MSSTTPADDATRSNLPLLCCATLASVTVGGTNYAFSLYGTALQSALSLTEAQVVTLSTTIFFGGLASWIPGLAIDAWGERLAIMVGGTGSACCLFFFWLLGKHIIMVASGIILYVLCITGLLMFWNMALVVGSVFKLVAAHCGPGSKGTAVGLTKGYLGLGAGVYATLFSALHSSDALNCLLIMAGYNIMATTVPAMLLLPPRREGSPLESRDDLTPRHFYLLYAGLAMLVSLVLGHSLFTLYSHNSNDDKKDGKASYFLLIITTLIWMGPILGLLCVPKRYDGDDFDDELHADGASVASPEEEPLLQHFVPEEGMVQRDNADVVVVSTDEEADDDEVSHSSHERSLRQFQLREMLRTPEAWLLCYSCTILVGSGTLLINNLAQMAQALQLPPSKTPAVLALFMAAQCVGRVITGTASEYTRSTVRRPIYLVGAALLAMIAHGLLALQTPAAFHIGVALEGLAFGAVWPLVVLLVEELFGKEYLGANYMFYDGFVIAMGTLVISKWISSNIYASHTTSGEACVGTQCFRTTHWIVVVLAGTTVVSSLILRSTKLAKLAYETKPSRHVT